MIEPRSLTLIGAHGLFAGLSLLLIARPEWSAAVYPFYGAIFLWSEARRESEHSVIFVFLVTVVGLVLAARAPALAGKAAMFVEIVGLWALSGALSWHRGRALAEQRQMMADGLALDAKIRDNEREITYYRSYLSNIGAQLRLRRDLVESARSLGSTMDAREVQTRLVSILSSRFPQAKVQVLAGASPQDPLVSWAFERRGPVLVRDTRTDERFRQMAIPCRSGVVIPLKVMQRTAGFVKLESDQPGAFGPEDVKSADIFATMAALSLENVLFYERIHQQATHDPLTQLFSHKAFQTRLQEELLRSGRSQTPLSFILMDLDHFKSYNDRYGHQAGDYLLKTVAGIISSFARPVDFPARYGGEEFCLIVPNFVHSEAVDLANKIRVRLASEPFMFQGQKTSATVSIGVSSFPTDATTSSQIIRVADERMYRAKENGRNQVVG